MAQPLAPSRRAMLRGLAMALLTSAAAAATPVDPFPDAELVRICHVFAEAEYREWWRYVTAPDHLADAEASDPDWTMLDLIETTPATTPAGWAAKALALAAWHREAYDDADPEGDACATLLAGLLRDMVASTRSEILARCAADFGPLSEGYTVDARWTGRVAVVTAAAPLVLPHVDAELLAVCAAFTHAEQDVAQLEREGDDDTFGAAVSASHAAMVRVSGLRARTVAGLRAKVAVARAVYAADEPMAMVDRFGGPAQRHDVLAWSTLADLADLIEVVA